MFILKNWYLKIYRDKVRGNGNCFGNPRFWEGYSIHTSPVVDAEIDFEANELRLTTKSGSCYHLPFEEINTNALKETQEAVEALGISLNIDKCVELWHEEVLRRKSQIMDVLNERELYVQMSGGEGAYKAYYKTGNGEVVDAPIHVHVGTFQDSVLIGGGCCGLCDCDWRFFPEVSSIKCYCWNGELDAVRLENIGDDFVFQGRFRDIPCKHGETIVVKKEDFTGEGGAAPEAVRTDVEDMISQEEINELLGSGTTEICTDEKVSQVEFGR